MSEGNRGDREMTTHTVNFQQVKQAASVDQVIRYLGLILKQHGDTWRGRCHICKAADDRAFVITTSKRLFHCFKCKEGGDMLKLVAVSQGLPVRDAAIELAKLCGVELLPSGNKEQVPGTGSGTVPPSPERKGFDAEKYAAGLDPAHASLEPLGISPDTLKAWKAGFSPTGVNRGRLALPIAARDGTVIAYCGRALDDQQQPALIFPNGVTPSEHIFGGNHVNDGELILVRDPIDVLKAYDNGIENVVSFLTEGISSAQLEYLSVLMDEKHIDTLMLF
ncbi:MAG: CHC2 zinc finger domain-containing protein [Candidatus Pacebacteria bacterium]|nr:CHC2 zinc finger domain-containing protein [Candidatus Paceibacterota bacterium]